jgi:uncharacterized coiled-coil protein SlyX
VQGSKIDKALFPGRCFVCEDPSEQKTKHDRARGKTHLMYSLIRLKTLASCVLLCLAFLPRAQAAPDIVPPPDGCYPNFTTAEGCQALKNVNGNANANTALGWRALYSAGGASFNVGVGAGALVLDHDGGDANTAVGTAALLLNSVGMRNTAVGAAAMVYNDGDLEGMGSFNGAVGAFALNANEQGFSNNAMGDSALFKNIDGAANTAVGDLALENNDATGDGDANNNVAVGASALINDVNGSENTGVGSNVGPNIANGFNNTYLGNFVGSLDGTPDEDSTIRIGDLSNGNGAGSLACYIGGIWNNPQPVGGSVVVVTLDTDTDELGYDPGVATGGKAPAVPHRNPPQRRVRPQAGDRQAMLNDKVEKLQATVAQQQATVAQQQKQIETLTTQLREQAAQIQKVSAQVELIKPAPRVVENR